MTIKKQHHASSPKSRIKKKNLVPTPHDRFFRAAMANKRVAREFFESHLPEAFQEHVDLNTLHLEPGSFIDEELQLQITDVLYSLTWKGKTAFLYTLVEHLREADPLMAFRNIKYRIGIMDDHLKKTGELPIVFVLVVYNGDTKYPYSTNLFDLFGEDKVLARETFLQPFDLIDLSQITDEKLKKRAWSGILELSLKHTRERDLMPFLRDVVQLIKLIFDDGDSSYVMTVFNYLMKTGEIQDIEALRHLIHQNLSNEQEKKVMTIAEQFRQQGRREGIEKGIEKGREEGIEEGVKITAIALIQMNLLADEQIAAVTKLPLEKIIALRREYATPH
jgi:predicted transposase/invertase (TIGR01784 family)